MLMDISIATLNFSIGEFSCYLWGRSTYGSLMVRCSPTFGHTVFILKRTSAQCKMLSKTFTGTRMIDMTLKIQPLNPKQFITVNITPAADTVVPISQFIYLQHTLHPVCKIKYLVFIAVQPTSACSMLSVHIYRIFSFGHLSMWMMCIRPSKQCKLHKR